MSKKSAAARKAQSPRKPQSAGKASGATLVSGAHVSTAPEAETSPAGSAQTAAKTAAPVRVPSAASASRAHALALKDSKTARPAAPKPAPATPREQTDRAYATRVARARAAQRTRSANLINPENYGYVLSDLKLILGLAVAMFIVIIALHFVLG